MQLLSTLRREGCIVSCIPNAELWPSALYEAAMDTSPHLRAGVSTVTPASSSQNIEHERIQHCLVSQCSHHMTLRKYFNDNPKADPKVILLSIAATMDFLHSQSSTKQAVVHGNLHTANIRVGHDGVHLSGFEYCGIDPVASTCGDEPGGYWTSMAPELVDTGVRTTQTDVYAFGMLIFDIYAGRRPFPRLVHLSATVQLYVGRRPGRSEILRSDFTDDLWQLMTDCWAQDAARRPTMAEVHERLAKMLPEVGRAAARPGWVLAGSRKTVL